MSKTRRTIKNSAKVASVSRAEAMSAAKSVKAHRTRRSVTLGTYLREAPVLVKK
ncbi:MAG: hypothetical protein AAF845_06065 [Bacteroidota bacterium]